MKKTAIFATLVTAFLLSSCAEKPTISGKMEQLEGKVSLSLIEPQKTVPQDTIALDGGKFSFNITDEEANFYVLETSDNYYIPLFVQPGEKIELNISGEGKERTYTVAGSPDSERILRIDGIIKKAAGRIDSLDQVSLQYKDSANFMLVKMELDKTFQKVVEQAQNSMKELIDEDPGNLTNLFIFPKSIGNFPLISHVDDMPYFEKVAAGLDEKYPGNKHADFFKDRLASLKESEIMRKELEKTKAALAPGNPSPDIALADRDGNVKKLSDLKGKVVLVDFWASWCGPCRRENPNLVRMYNEYKGKGFDVYSVSLDGLPQQPNPRNDWMGAIEQDGLSWPNHVSDLKGWSSSVIPQFGFQGIPYTVLVDRDGNIIATELRGPALEAKLKEVLGS
jgi:thiol-disulfide isomerase/thioredoxin